MKQDNIDQRNEISDQKSKVPSTQNNLHILQNKLKINLQDSDEEEVVLTFQRRPQFKIRENSRKRLY